MVLFENREKKIMNTPIVYFNGETSIFLLRIFCSKNIGGAKELAVIKWRNIIYHTIYYLLLFSFSSSTWCRLFPSPFSRWLLELSKSTGKQALKRSMPNQWTRSCQLSTSKQTQALQQSMPNQLMCIIRNLCYKLS